MDQNAISSRLKELRAEIDLLLQRQFEACYEDTGSAQQQHLASRERLEQIKHEIAELRKGKPATPRRRGHRT